MDATTKYLVQYAWAAAEAAISNEVILLWEFFEDRHGVVGVGGSGAMRQVLLSTYTEETTNTIMGRWAEGKSYADGEAGD